MAHGWRFNLRYIMFSKSKIEEAKREWKSAIWPILCCWQSITVVSSLLLHSPWVLSKNGTISSLGLQQWFSICYFLAISSNILTLLFLNKKIRLCKTKQCYTWFYTWATINNLTIGLISHIEKWNKNGWICHNIKRTNFSAL